MGRTGIAYDPWEHAEKLGVRVVTSDLTRSKGIWVPDARTIVLRANMGRIEARCLLAHKLGHVYFEHFENSAEAEDDADRFAARYLIDPTELRNARSTTANIDALAAELKVTSQVLRRYLSEHGAAAA